MSDELIALAQLYDVQTEYVDASGEVRQASDDALRAVLGALGARMTDPRDAIREERLRRHVQTLEPVVALPSIGRQVVEVALSRSVHPRDCWLSLEAEDGSVRRMRLMPSIQRPLGTASVEGRTIDRYEAHLSTPLDMLRAGYYNLSLEGPDLEASSLLVVAPRCPLPPPGWGVFMPVHTMRTARDWGVGSYETLRELATWAAGRGASVVGTLPLYPAFLDDPVEISPYLPVTRLGWNELFVDPTAVPELEASEDARRILDSSEFQEALAHVRAAPLADYPSSMLLVRHVLEPLARTLYGSSSARRAALESFAAARPDLVAYARFRAGETVAPNGHAPQGQSPSGPLPESQEARYHLYAQFLADQQLAAAGGRLFLDLPVGVHPDGFDPLFEPDAFAAGVEGGAPPDLFFERGQRWGFRPLHPRAIRESRYRHVIATLRHAMSQASVLRLDHVMGLYRLYWVPTGADATDGAYVRYRDDELRAVVALEAARSGTAIVGEDLGTVPEEVRDGMAEDRMLRSWVLEFEVSADAPLPDPPEQSMASIGTHDLPRFVTFFEAPGRSAWRRAMGGDARRALRACLDHMAAGPARVVLVDIEDLWLERLAHNRPGTGPEAGNWRHRSARTLEEVFADPEIAAALERIDELRREG